MKRRLIYLFAIVAMIANWGCEEKEPVIDKDDEQAINKRVNEWIQDEMSIYYYWNDKLPRDANFSLKPNEFFESILYRFSDSQPDGDRFSWIQDNYKELQDGVPNLFGTKS